VRWTSDLVPQRSNIAIVGAEVSSAAVPLLAESDDDGFARPLNLPDHARAGPGPAPTVAVLPPHCQPSCPAPADGATYYANCGAVGAVGAALIHRGDPGDSTKLDRDGDGIGCE